MKVVYTQELSELMKEFPEGGVVFCEYKPDIMASDIMITDGDFGATEIVPHHGEVFDFDWNIKEYQPRDLFVVFDNNDVLQMIQTLVRGLKIPLIDEVY